MKMLLAALAALAALAFAGSAGAVGSPWDTSFDGDGRVTTDFGSNEVLGDVVVQPDGKVVVVGTRGGTFGAFAVARYNTDGSLDSSFDGDGKAENGGGFGTGSEAFAVALQPDGKIVVAGNVCGGQGCDFQLQRYNTNGSLDTSFNGNGTVGVGVGGARNDTAHAVAIQPDGKILAAGDSCAPTFLGGCLVAVMRFEANGSIDAGFGGGVVATDLGGGSPSSSIRGVGVQSDGTVVLAGTHLASDDPGCSFGSTCFSIIKPKIALVRYSSSGTLLGTTFARYTDGLSGRGDALAIQSDGRVVVTGVSTDDSFERDFGVARFTSAGALDPTFSSDGRQTTDLGGIDLANDVGVQSSGGIVVIGTTGASGQMVRYTSFGALDPAFNGDGRFTDSFAADAVAIAPDGKIVVAGTLAGDFAVSRFVADGGDGTAPVLSLPGALLAEATSPAGAVVAYTATATDNEDPAPDVVCTPASGSTFGLGVTTVSCTATDDVGNQSSGSFSVHVVDTIAPTILAGTIRVNADSAAGTVVNYLVAVHDAVDPSSSLDCQPPSGGTFPIGVTVVTCVAEDASGNSSERSFRIIVIGFRDQVSDLNDAIANLPLTGQADVRRDSALQFCQNAFAPANWASNSMPRTNDAGRFALTEIRQCVLYLMGPPTEVATASASIRLALINLVCTVAHARYDEVKVASGANASRLVQAKTSLDQADAAPGTNGALFDCVNAWSILRNEPPQYTS